MHIKSKIHVLGSAGGEGIVKWQIRPKHPLKLFNLAQIFTGYSIYSSEWNCIGLRTSRAILRISVSGGGAGLPPPPPPSEGVCQIYHNLLYLKPLFNFLHVLKINKDILNTFGGITSQNRNYWIRNIVVKWSKIDANQPKPVPNIGL